MKLSKLQVEVIQLMQKGWELGSYHGLGVGYGNPSFTIHLQKNGLGKGGECVHVKVNTFWSLQSRGLIEEVENQPYFAHPKRYQLTQKGKDWVP